MTPEKFLDAVLTEALDKAVRVVSSPHEYPIVANVDDVETTKFNIENATATARVVWRIIPKNTPTQAFDLPTTLRFEVERELLGTAVRVTDMRVVSRGGCDVEIAGVPTIVSGEDYTDAESAGDTIDLFNYVNHQIAVAADLWASASLMAQF